MFDVRDLAVPIVAAPLAGGPSTDMLVAAVCEAGGLGFLAAGYKPVEAVAAEVEAVQSATAAPFGVNLFVVAPYDADPAAIRGYAESLEPEASRLRVPLGEPHWDDDFWQGKLDLLLETRPAVASFTFGCPTPDVLSRLRDAGISTMVTVTTVAEATEAVSRGAASLAVQGPGAGGHRGTWDPDAVPATTPLLELVDAVVSSVDVPIVAGGGVGDARDVADILQRGAAAAQVGTAYLRAEEAGTNQVYRAALGDPAFVHTGLTRAYTGRWARGLENRFMSAHADAPAGYPHLHHLTAPLRAAAVKAGDAQVPNLWAGTGHRATRAGSALEITRSLIDG